MTVSFENIPSNWKIPLFWLEVDPSMAGLPIVRQPALLIGVMMAEGNYTPDVPVPIGTQAQVDQKFGAGSEVSRMAKAFFANNFSQEVWACGVMEAGAEAVGTITVDTPPTEAGTINLYIGGEHVYVRVGATDSVVDIADNMAIAINAEPSMPVVAFGGGTNGVCALTCKWKGINGNDIDMRDSYYGKIGGEELPPGVTITYSGSGRLAGGSGVPDFTQTIVNLGEQDFEYVAIPYTDSTTLLDFETQFGFTDSGRWGWMRQLYGHLFTGKRGTYEDLIQFGQSRNSGIVSCLGLEASTPTPVYEWVAAYTAKAARALTNDPARPLQTLSLQGVKPAPFHQRFNFAELNALATNGIATQKTGSDNQPMILRDTTMYKLNLYSQSDDAYELVTTMATLARIIRDLRHAITTKYPRHKLANDGTRFGTGMKIVTPGIIKGELIAVYRMSEFQGLTEDTKNFKRHLVVERDSNDPNRVNVLWPPDLVNQLRVFAVLCQFRLQYDRGIDTEIAA